MRAVDFVHRHPSTQHMMRTLEPNPRLHGVAADIAEEFWGLTCRIVALCQDGQELITSLRKLREAKDCAVIQALLDSHALGDTRSEGERL